MDMEYERIVHLRDLKIYADYKEQIYKLFFEGLVFYNSPQGVISDFINLKEQAMDILDECETNSTQMFNPNAPVTGTLGIGKFKVDDSILYFLDEVEAFTSGSVYSVYQRFSDELNRLGREYL